MSNYYYGPALDMEIGLPARHAAARRGDLPAGAAVPPRPPGRGRHRPTIQLGPVARLGSGGGSVRAVRWRPSPPGTR